MKENHLIKILQSLHKKELRDLSKWLRSPFFNQRPDVIELFDYLRNHIQKQDHLLDKQFIFSILYKNEPFQDFKVRRVMSFLLKQIKDYLAYQNWQQQAFEQKISTATALRQHRQDFLFQKGVKQLKEHFNTTENQTHLHHFHQYQLHLEQYRMSLQTSRIEAQNLQEVSDSLVTFFLCESLRVACLMTAHQTMNTKKEYQPQMLAEVLLKTTTPPFSGLPEIAIYKNTYLALTQPEEPTYFQELKSLITIHWQQFSIEEMRDIYLLAINYCIKKLNHGQANFIREALDLYKIGLEKKILFEQNELSRFTYHNALTLSLMLKDFAWARTFLETYKNYLPKRFRHNIYLYNLTVYHFKKEEYHKVMELLQQVQFRDVLYNLESRRMLLRSYFEMEAFDALDALLDSFRVFIQRRRDLGYHKENFMNLIRFVKKLIKIGHQKSERLALLKEVQETDAVADKTWLLEKINGR